MSSVKKNYVYSVMYQLLTIMIPLVTMPYLSRILGAENIGIFSYTNSIVQYFVLISMLGILDYGNRTIASAKNKIERSKLFEELYLIQFFTSLLAITLYCIYIVFCAPRYRTIVIIQGISLLAALLDINWFFFGIEKFKLTVTRNMIIKIVSLFCVFIFVRSRYDLWKYVFIIVPSALISNGVLWFFLKKEIELVKIDFKDSLKHLLPCLILMLPLLARSIFVYMNKTMLGFMSGMKETGYYEYSEKIILAVTSLLTPLGTVMLPRISNLLAKGEKELTRRYTSLSIDFVSAIGIAFSFGVLAISDVLVVVFLGADYVGCGPIVNIMAFTIILVGWTNVIRTQFILPYKKDNIYMIAVVLGAMIDFGINVLLIPQLGAFGAAIGWLAAEIVITITQTYYASNALPIGRYLYNAIGYVINAVIMFFLVKLVCSNMGSTLMSLILGTITGTVVYGIMTLIYLKIFRKELWNDLKMYTKSRIKK